MARKSKSDVYVANTSFACELEGERYSVRKGELVRAGHVLLDSYPESFDSQDDQRVKYDVEQASAAPGEKRSR